MVRREGRLDRCHRLWMLFIIMSRRSVLLARNHQDVVLHEVPRPTIQNDISAFLKDEFLKIREEYNNDRPPGIALGHDWPGDEVLQALADMAVPLLIIAATVCRYVGELKRNPQKGLETILEFQRMGAMSQMEQTYLPVLKQLTAP
jgi:hypothetical protein